VIASGVPWDARLQSREGCLFWLGEPAWPSLERVLRSYRPGNHRAVVFQRFFGDSAPAVCGDRFYWSSGTRLAPPGRERLGPAVISARPDGSDARVLLDLRAHPSLEAPVAFLGVHRDRLYCTFQTKARRRSPGDPATVPVLCRIRPERPDPVERLKELPAEIAHATFDGDYCYFVAREHQENWLDWSQEGLSGQTVPVLYRCRLPD
jgi:hypothetical protein